MWLELDPFERIRIKTERGTLSVRREFAEKLAVRLGFMKNRFFPIYIGKPTKVDVPEKLLEFLKHPEKVLEVAKEMGYKTEISDWENEHEKWRNFWVFAWENSGYISEYVFRQSL